MTREDDERWEDDERGSASFGVRRSASFGVVWRRSSLGVVQRWRRFIAKPEKDVNGAIAGKPRIYVKEILKSWALQSSWFWEKINFLFSAKRQEMKLCTIGNEVMFLVFFVLFFLCVFEDLFFVFH